MIPYTVSPELEARIVTWRRHLHQHPELSFQEHRTSAYVEQQLRDLSFFMVTRPTPTSVLAVLQTGRPGQVALLRADMDALPIQEENEVSYVSQVPGVMHACGHDGHTAMMLGAAQALGEHQAELCGEVRFIFQHAEETPPGGAAELVAQGLLSGVDYALGAHLWAAGPSGHIGIGSGPQTAAPDRFDLHIKGQGGHAAMPHQTVDPVVVAAQVISAFQSIVSRTVDPLESAVVSVTQLDAGSAYNVIPDEVRLQGTVRTFAAEVRRDIPQRMQRLLDGISSGFGASATFEYVLGYPSVVNDTALTGAVRAVAVKIFGEEQVLNIAPSMAGEDFAYFSERVPACFFSVGSGNPARGITFPHHHPRFDIDEPALKTGTALFVNTVLTLNARPQETP
ncbi:amidohydrolase [Deinococcus rubellus]|uniref:M20 metallopeptidase family protein n=1 Tax=Deinococcus rubellus TaxID=1889240 RepID=UPI0031E9D42F